MRHALLLPLLLAACRQAGESPFPADADRLPTGRYLDPVVPSTKLAGAFPLGVVTRSGGREVAMLLSGFTANGVQLLDRASGRSTMLAQRAAFVGLALAPDGRTLYASGGNQDVVYRYDWHPDGSAALRDSLVLASKDPRRDGTRYPAGIGVSPDGRHVYVAENLADSLAVLDAASGRVVARYGTERYPYGVAVAPDGTVYVSAWGGTTVGVFAPSGEGVVAPRPPIPAGRHPSALLLDREGTRLFVASASTDRIAVVDTRTRRTVAVLSDAPPAGPSEGSTPNALALSGDGRTLYVAEADNNAVAVFELPENRLAGRIPTDWYPTALAVAGDSLLVLSGKGRPPTANPGLRSGPGGARNLTQHTLGQLAGTIAAIAPPRPGSAALATLSARVARANFWTTKARESRAKAQYPPLRHVIYIIKENRTYDQVLGDLPIGDGDTSLVLFPRAVTPNHHALAERFGVYDRFFVNAEVSADGHNWSMAAYATDYTVKTSQQNYSGRGRTYDYEGTNRQDWDSTRKMARIPDDDVAEPGNGYLWNSAERAGITFRNYGEFVTPAVGAEEDALKKVYVGVKPFLARNTNLDFPGYDTSIPDQRRADVFIAELRQFEARGELPRLIIMRLPNDHTDGGRAGRPTPRAHVADNDLALGRVIEALSRTRFWESTVVFVLEDDAQDGPDHVDSHRSPLLVISPWAAAGLHHRWANTTDVLATIAEILGLGSLSQFDHYGEPLRDVWRSSPDTRPYAALVPAVPLDEKNPSNTGAARASEALDLRYEDRNDDATFNRILWMTVKGEHVPYPGTRQASAPEWARGLP